MGKNIYKIFLLTIFFCWGIVENSYCKKKEIVSFKANSLKHSNGLNILKGNVEFIKEGLKINADEAEYEEQKKIIARGNVRIERKTNDNKTIIIYSNILFYDVDKELAEFPKPLKLIDGENILTCDQGQYNDSDDTAIFLNNVKITSKNQIVKCELLEFENLNSKIINQHPEIFQDLNINLKRPKKVYTMHESVSIENNKNNTILKSNDAIFYKDEDRLKLYGDPILKKIIKDEEYFLFSKKIIIKKDENSNKEEDKQVIAQENVNLFNKELKAKSNEIIYTPSKSLVQFGINSIFWTKDSQLTADEAKLYMENDNVKEMHLNNEAFVIQKDDFNNFNQIKGEIIRMYFKKNKIHTLLVKKDAQSIQFLSNEKKGGLIGVNHIKCDRIKIDIKNNKAKKVSFLGKNINNKINGLIIAPKLSKPQNTIFRGFNWRPEEKPTKDIVNNLFNNRSKKESKKI